jgi:hypothetical protein
MAEYKLQYVGSQQFVTSATDELFSQRNINTISDKVSQLLAGVHPEGKRIIVPDETILHVVSRIFDNDHGPNDETIDNAIGVIVSQIRDEYDTIEKNNKLSVWVTQYGSNGEGNSHGLMAHAPIKIRHKRPTPGQFNMRY